MTEAEQELAQLVEKHFRDLHKRFADDVERDLLKLVLGRDHLPLNNRKE
jgi:hypothetical protein